MKFIRRLLGIFVMVAGVIGLLLSLAGLISIWVFKPAITTSVNTTISTLNSSIGTSQQVMETTQEALGATVASVDALSEMLGTTAASVEDTQPILDQVNSVMGETLPATFEDATASLETAQEAAMVLESSMKSLDNFRLVMSSNPLLAAFIDKPEQSFSPEKPLADSLGDLADNLADMPATFTSMSASMDKADDNLGLIQNNLITMSTSVGLISASISEYQAMLSQSEASMDNLKSMLSGMETNLATILNGAVIVLTLFFLWLLATQVVIFSQGWELYQGTAGRMESDTDEVVPAGPSMAA